MSFVPDTKPRKATHLGRDATRQNLYCNRSGKSRRVEPTPDKNGKVRERKPTTKIDAICPCEMVSLWRNSFKLNLF